MNAIIAPVGGCGNHIRWLCLLDKTFDISSFTKKDKFDFILNEVYGEDRTWHNWLIHEWKWREFIDKIFYFGHSLVDLKNDKTSQPLKKILYINATGENCYRHYVKFNSCLNNTPKITFIKQVNYLNDTYNQIYNKQKIKLEMSTVDFNNFYKNSLSSEFIEKINTFFDIKIPLNQAMKIHDKWIELNNKAEIEIMKEFKELYSKNYSEGQAD